MNKTIFTREVRVGIMAIVALGVLYFGLNFLKGIDIFSSTNYYYASYEDIGGLVASSPVYIKGFKVGQVEEVKYDFSKKASFIVKISVSKDIQLPKDAIIQLYDEGLMGGKAVQIVFAPIKSTAMFMPNDTLPTSVSVGLMGQIAGDLMPKIDAVATQADSLLRSVRHLAENKDLAKSLSSIQSTTADLAVTSSGLKKMMNKDVPQILDNVNTVTSDFKHISGNLRKIDFEATFSSINHTINNLNLITDKMNKGEGTIGQLLNNKDLYINLSNTASHADQLMVDLKNNPKKYVHFSVFGSKSK